MMILHMPELKPFFFFKTSYRKPHIKASLIRTFETEAATKYALMMGAVLRSGVELLKECLQKERFFVR